MMALLLLVGFVEAQKLRGFNELVQSAKQFGKKGFDSISALTKQALQSDTAKSGIGWLENAANVIEVNVGRLAKKAECTQVGKWFAEQVRVAKLLVNEQLNGRQLSPAEKYFLRKKSDIRKFVACKFGLGDLKKS